MDTLIGRLPTFFAIVGVVLIITGVIEPTLESVAILSLWTWANTAEAARPW